MWELNEKQFQLSNDNNKRSTGEKYKIIFTISVWEFLDSLCCCCCFFICRGSNFLLEKILNYPIQKSKHDNNWYGSFKQKFLLSKDNSSLDLLIYSYQFLFRIWIIIHPWWSFVICMRLTMVAYDFYVKKNRCPLSIEKYKTELIKKNIFFLFLSLVVRETICLLQYIYFIRHASMQKNE
jgi:hypothetical protein